MVLWWALAALEKIRDSLVTAPRREDVIRAEVHTVGIMAATLMSGLLANAKRYEERAALKDKTYGDEEMEKIMAESLQETNLFSYEGRRKVIGIAWETFREVAKHPDAKS